MLASSMKSEPEAWALAFLPAPYSAKIIIAMTRPNEGTTYSGRRNFFLLSAHVRTWEFGDFETERTIVVVLEEI